MRSNFKRRALPGLLIAALSGTAAASTSADLAAVRELAQVSTLADVSSSRVDQETDEAVRRLLQSPLDADTAVQIALLNNRSLRATLRELGVARGRLAFETRFDAPQLPEQLGSLFGVHMHALTLQGARVLLPEPSGEAR